MYKSLVIDVQIYLSETFQFKDINRVLRKALLSDVVLPRLNVSLVMAGLSPTPFGVTNSGRGFKALLLPAYLDSRKIVDSWWLKSKYISDEDGAAVVSTSNNSKQVLFLLTEFVNNYFFL
jgi:hypothetical protein